MMRRKNAAASARILLTRFARWHWRRAKTSQGHKDESKGRKEVIVTHLFLCGLLTGIFLLMTAPKSNPAD
jgi:hypothetical protein